MASQAEIVNVALSRLGSARITSITDDTAPARLANALWDVIVDDVIVQAHWTSAIHRQTLVQDSENTPIFEFTYSYTLPTDPYCLLVIDVNELKAGDINYKVEGRKLLTDESSVKVRYLKRITDTEGFDTNLMQAIVTRLAAEMAYHQTGNATLVENLWRMYHQTIANARAIDSQQGSTDILTADDLLDVR